MRLHVVNLPHSMTTDEWPSCAYTQKVRRFATMMTRRGHHVILYAGREHQGEVTELVPCATRYLEDGRMMDWDANGMYFGPFNAKVIEEMRERLEPHDPICLITGQPQAVIADAFPDENLVCEFGVGYSGVLPHSSRCWESYAWMHVCRGAAEYHNPMNASGIHFDCVIPNYFDVDDFPAGDGAGGYVLYVGRLIERKGLGVAIEAARAAGLPLKVAGAQGDYRLPPDAQFVGPVGVKQRAELMGGAVALLAPTLYLEPFGGVAVEAQMCGTPAITTDFGAFTETVEQGVSGFRCHTLREFVNAIHAAPGLSRRAIRARAIANYSLDAIAPMYERHFDRLDTLWRHGWYEMGEPELEEAA